MTLQTTPNRLATCVRTSRLLKTCVLAASLGFVSLQAYAGDSALYGPTAPKGSTFVRVYNASNAEVSASVGNTNLSDKPLTLKTADGKTAVVEAVKAKGTGEREINPVKVSLALYDGATKVGDVKPVALERGEAAVLYVTGSGSSLSPVWVKRPVSTR